MIGLGVWIFLAVAIGPPVGHLLKRKREELARESSAQRSSQEPDP